MVEPDFRLWVGTWESRQGSIEEWETTNDGSLTGIGFALEHGDTTIFEYLSLRKADNRWHYFARVPDQNEGREVPFVLEAWTETLFQFSNQEHDFPQSLNYHFVTTDSLDVVAKGIRNDGSPREITFNFTRKR